MQQRYIPSFFTELFPQYVKMYATNPMTKHLAAEVHFLWRVATAFIQPGKTNFRIVKTGVETMAGFGDFAFSNLRIEPEDTPAFEKWLADTAIHPLSVLEQFTGDGFKVSVSYVIDQNSFCVSIIGTKETKLHKNMGLSAWSDDLGEAMAIAWYKHYKLCDGGEWPIKNNGKRWG